MKPLKNVPFRSLRLSAQSPRCIRPAGAGLEIFNPADNGKRFYVGNGYWDLASSLP